MYTRKRSKTQGCVSVCRNLDDTNAMERRMKRRERERERRGSTRVKSKKREEEIKRGGSCYAAWKVFIKDNELQQKVSVIASETLGLTHWST